MRRVVAAIVLLAALALPAAAPAQNRALVILDASKSMNEPAGDGGTRLDAAKRAVDALVGRLPAGSSLGLRVYGSKVAGVARAVACRDSTLAIPVGPLEKASLTATVGALQGRGRTPIGRSLLAAPGDLGGAAGRRAVVLVSDGGDDCAPPDPCRAAATVARGGLDLTISVVGLQVSARVRRQLECIARAGGGAYVGVGDADRLGDELSALLGRAFRSYAPAGTRVRGGTAAGAAPTLGAGLFQETLKPGDERWYAVRVPAGRRLVAAVTAIPSPRARGQAALASELRGPGGALVANDGQVLYGQAAGEDGRVVTSALRTPGPVGASGRYLIHVRIADDGLDPLPLPIELGVQLLAPGAAPGLVRTPGGLPRASASPVARVPAPTASAAPDGAADGAGGGGRVGWGPVAAIGVAALALGFAAAWTLAGRRRA